MAELGPKAPGGQGGPGPNTEAPRVGALRGGAVLLGQRPDVAARVPGGNQDGDRVSQLFKQATGRDTAPLAPGQVDRQNGQQNNEQPEGRGVFTPNSEHMVMDHDGTNDPGSRENLADALTLSPQVLEQGSRSVLELLANGNSTTPEETTAQVDQPAVTDNAEPAQEKGWKKTILGWFGKNREARTARLHPQGLGGVDAANGEQQI